MSPSFGLLIINLYFWSVFLVQTLGIQMVNIHCPNPLHSPSVGFFFYTTLHLKLVFLTCSPPPMTHGRHITHIRDRSLAGSIYLEGGLSHCSVFTTLACAPGASSISASFSREDSNHGNIYLPFWLYIVFTITTKPNTKYLLTTYLMLNE